MPAPLKDVVRSNVMLDRTHKQKLLKMAAKRDRSLSSIIREAIDLLLTLEEEKPQ